MKAKLSFIALLLAALLSCAAPSPAQEGQVAPKADKQEKKKKPVPPRVPDAPEVPEVPEEPQVRTVAADPAVVISVCLVSGNIIVTGGDRSDVNVKAEADARITLRRAENPGASTPATRLEVLVSDSTENSGRRFGECQSAVDIELEVPRGATVYAMTRDGDIDISDVSEVRAESTSGNVSVRHLARSVEATSISGDIFYEESSGRARLKSFSGSIEAINAKVVEANDFLEAKTLNGDIRLEGVEQARVEASTISGEINLRGGLARGGFYEFKTTSGDITLLMPASVSFQVNAGVARGGEIVTDFPIKYAGASSSVSSSASAVASSRASNVTSVNVATQARLVGSYGTGPAATINLTSFSGTLRLRKL